MKEIEAKLNTTIKESQARSEQVVQLEGTLKTEKQKLYSVQAEKASEVNQMSVQIVALKAESSSKI
mgnify:FL=1